MPPGLMPGAAGAPPPAEAPMMAPQQAGGDEAMADVNVNLAMQVLSNTIAMYAPGSAKAVAVIDVLKRLSKDFGEKDKGSKDLMPAEIQQLLSSLPQHAGGQPPNPLMGGGMPPPMQQ